MERLHNLDLLKVIAMLMVISLHAGMWHGQFLATGSIASLIQYGGRMLSEGVPIFVLVNGYLLFGKNSFDLNKHLKKTVKIFLLLVVWSLILAILGSLINGTSLGLPSIWKLFIDVRSGSLYNGPMWFMQALFAVYLIYPILRLVYESEGAYFEYLFGVVLAFTAGMSVVSMGTVVCPLVLPECDVVSEIYSWLDRLNPLANGSFILFFMLGGMFRRHTEKLKKHRKMWILFGVSAFVVAFAYCVSISFASGELINPGFNYSSAFTPVVLLGWYCLTMNFDGGRIYPVIKSMGANTLGIYFLHMICIWLVGPLFAGANFVSRVAEVILIFGLCYVASFVLRKIPGVRTLFST